MKNNKAAARDFHVVTNPKENQIVEALTARPPAEIAEPFSYSRSARRTATLPLTLRRSLASEKNAALLFTSAYRRESAPTIAFHVARTAAMQSSNKVLYLHISDRVPRFFRDIEYQIPVPLDDFVQLGGGNILPFVVLEDSGLVCACFRGPGENVKREDMKALMASLRRCFELTIIGGDNTLSGGTALAFADVVDGTILVAEAERTRVPVARKLKNAIEQNGGQVIGAVLNRRQYHIPKWLYKTLYGQR